MRILIISRDAYETSTRECWSKKEAEDYLSKYNDSCRHDIYQVTRELGSDLKPLKARGQ